MASKRLENLNSLIDPIDMTIVRISLNIKLLEVYGRKENTTTSETETTVLIISHILIGPIIYFRSGFTRKIISLRTIIPKKKEHIYPTT